VPAAATGILPSGQGLAGAMLTVGTSVFTGAGSFGSGPNPWASGSLAISPQAHSSKLTAMTGIGERRTLMAVLENIALVLPFDFTGCASADSHAGF